MRLDDARMAALSTMGADEPAPIVALHGSAANGRQWRALVEAMQDRRRVICPDLPGYGAAPRAVAPVAAMMDAEAAVIMQGIIEIGQPVHLVAHSYGAAIALKVAMKAPSLLASLTLIEPAMFHLLNNGDENDRKLYRQISAIAGMISAAICEGSNGAGMERFVDFWNGRGTYSGMDREVRKRLAAQIGQVASNFAASMVQDWKIDACNRISCPTMAIMGLESRLVAQRVTEMVAEAIPDMQLAMISDAGHMLPFTHPAIVNRLIAGHIAATEVGATEDQVLQAA